MTYYDFVIILCPSFLKGNKFDEFSPDGSYLGGQVRMQAAVDLYQRGVVKKLIVVGGMDNKKGKWAKVDGMRRYLIKNDIPKDRIIRICSQADTHGNLRAIYKTVKDKLKGEIGILTNFYHLPRAMRFAHDPQFKWDIKFIPICAEAVIESFPPTYLQQVPSFLVRIFSDIKGLNEWEWEKYRGQTDKENTWEGEVYPADVKNLDIK